MVTLKGGDTDQVVGVDRSADLDRWVLRIVEREMEMMKMTQEFTNAEAKFKDFLKEAKKLAYDGREFKGTTYADKVSFLRGIQTELSKKRNNSKTMYEECIYDCLHKLIGEEIWQTKKEALDLPLKK